jgi:chemotaxis protein methyltransferase CheR
MFDSLADGGVLFLGAADPMPRAPFQSIETDLGLLFRRPGGRSVSLPPRPPSFNPIRAAARRPRSAPPVAEPADQVPPASPPAESEAVSAVKALADRGHLAAALDAAEESLRADTMNPQLHYLLALVLSSQGENERAIASLKRALYLDPHLAMAWMTLGTLLRVDGDAKGAKRAFEAARRLSAVLEPDAPVPLADGVTSAYFADLAAREEARS